MRPDRTPTNKAVALAVAGAIVTAFPAGAAAAAPPAPVTKRHDPMNMQHSDNRHAAGLVRIGRQAIAAQDDAALDAYFAPDFIFHGPTGDLSYEQLKAYFASLRAAFTGLKVERAAIVGDGDRLASRTIFSGRFDRLFTQSPVGPLQPNGAEVTWEVINIFRYDEQSRLAEEWVQFDHRGFLEKLGAGSTETR